MARIWGAAPQREVSQMVATLLRYLMLFQQIRPAKDWGLHALSDELHPNDAFEPDSGLANAPWLAIGRVWERQCPGFDRT